MRRSRLRTDIPATLAGAAIGIAVGVGIFTFVYAKGASYLSHDAAACANCHVMREQFDGWVHSSHRAAATCNDCHTPHDFVGKWSTKALNGFWHSFYFTTGRYPDHLEIKPRNRRITNEACLKCHTEITQAILSGPETQCVRCHWDVGHME